MRVEAVVEKVEGAVIENDVAVFTLVDLTFPQEIRHQSHILCIVWLCRQLHPIGVYVGGKAGSGLRHLLLAAGAAAVASHGVTLFTPARG